MSSPFNQFSFIWASLALLALLAFALYSRRVRWRVSLLVLGMAVGVMTMAWLVIRPTSGPQDDPAQLQALLTNGRPTLVEFFSEY